MNRGLIRYENRPMKVKMKGIKHVEFYKCKEYVYTVLT